MSDTYYGKLRISFEAAADSSVANPIESYRNSYTENADTVEGGSAWVRSDDRLGHLLQYQEQTSSGMTDLEMFYIENDTGTEMRVVNHLPGYFFIEVLDYTVTGYTVTVGYTASGTASALTEGADFTAATSNSATATSLAAAINGISGVTSVAIGNYVCAKEDTHTGWLAVASSTSTGIDLHPFGIPLADGGALASSGCELTAKRLLGCTVGGGSSATRAKVYGIGS